VVDHGTHAWKQPIVRGLFDHVEVVVGFRLAVAPSGRVDRPHTDSLIEKHTGKRPGEGLPPPWVLRTVAAVAETFSAISGSAPPITRALLAAVAGGVPLFDCSKAKNELGLSPRSAEEVVVSTLKWAAKMGWLPTHVTKRVEVSV
jgi:hypothetical protein